MPTLANFDGASLVPNIAGPIGGLVDFLLSEKDKRTALAKEEADAKQRADELAAILGGNAEKDLQGIFARPALDSKALSTLGQVDPQAAQILAGILDRGSEEEFEAVRTEARKGMSLAGKIQSAGSFAAKQAMLADETARIVAQGGDTTRLVQLSNLDEAHLGLEMQKMDVVGQAMLDAIPKTKAGPLNFLSDPKRARAFANFMAKNPEAGAALLKERGSALARQATEATAAREAALPQSEFGRARRALEKDVASGAITQKEAAKELDRKSRGGGAGVRVIGRPTPVRLPEGGTGLLTSFSDGTTEIIPDVTPLRMELRERAIEQGAARVALEQPAARGERKEEEALGAARGEVRAGDLPRGRRETARARRATAAQERKFNFINDTIDTAIGQADSFTAGIGSITSGIPGSPAADLAATLQTISANVGFGALQTMRDNSPTGGALGQVSERELALLTATWGNVMNSQSPSQLKHNLRVFQKQQIESFKEVKQAFEDNFDVPFEGFDTPIPGAGGGDTPESVTPSGIKFRIVE